MLLMVSLVQKTDQKILKSHMDSNKISIIYLTLASFEYPFLKGSFQTVRTIISPDHLNSSNYIPKRFAAVLLEHHKELNAFCDNSFA